MKNMTTRKRFLLLLVTAGAALLLCGCSEKLVNENPDGGNVRLAARISTPEMLQFVSVLKLRISDGSTGVTLIDTILVFGRYDLEITLSVPAGVGRLFVLEACEAGITDELRTIYRGQTVASVGLKGATAVDILMEPVAPLVKLTPHATEVATGQAFQLELEAFNLPAVREASVIIYYDLRYISARPPIKGSTLGGLDSLEYVFEPYNLGERLEIRIFDTNPQSPSIVDNGGYSHLVTIPFTTVAIADSAVDSVIVSGIEIQQVSAIDVDSVSLPQGYIFGHDATVTLHPLADRVVDFPDAVLRAAIRRQIPSPTDDIMLSQVLRLEILNCAGLGIDSISGIDELVNLESLFLSYNNVSDLGPLAALKKLRTLYLDENLITDIGPLADLAVLRLLSLKNNQIVDISALAGLTNIRYLYLDDNSISDIAPLVDNGGLGSGDQVFLHNNPLDPVSINEHIPALESRGVSVFWQGPGLP
ncbi:MAG: leucine-rich repeat domain-containing protein [candidate division Zixibacteria bacterium]|nr:leucine-rich repeat domain-containing protein [candidate division Zixibacteria bacterium]